MSELQNQVEELEPEVDETNEAEIQNESSELAPDSEPQHEQNSEEPNDSNINQDAINKVINRKHYEAQEAKREAEELRQRLAQYEQQSSQAPVVPEKPDQFDDDYDAKFAAYERAVAERAKFDAQQELTRKQEQQALERQQLEQQQKLQQQLATYVENGKAAGLTQEEMVQTINIAESYGINQDIQAALLADADGALIVKHLAANPTVTMELTQMTPYQAALYIERTIRPAAKQLKPKQTTTPPPATRVQTGTVDPELGKYPHAARGTFS